jgi:peptide/nickel transport system permease protein
MPDTQSPAQNTDAYLIPGVPGTSAGGVGGPLGASAPEHDLEAGIIEPGFPAEYDDEVAAVHHLTQMQLVWWRFRHHRLALVGAMMLSVIVFLAVFAPFLTHTAPDRVHLDWIDFQTGATGPTLANFPDRIMGVDTIGHSVWSGVIYGARVSLLIGVAASLLTVVIGTVLGALSGYFGGAVDLLFQRLTDMVLSIPFLPLMIALSTIILHNPVLHQNVSFIVTFIILAFTGLGWPGVTRIVRTYYLTLREQQFIEAAKGLGTSDLHIIFRHILPNALSPIIVLFTLYAASFMTLEATLDFLGLGIAFPPTPTWGNMLTNAQDELLIGHWWWATFPGLLLLLTVLAINWIGDGLRDALDVRDQE